MTMGHDGNNPVLRAVRTQRLNAALSFIAGAGFIVMYLVELRGRSHAWFALVPIGVGLLFFARRDWRRAESRLHGLSVELRAAMQAERFLRRRNFDVRRNVPMPGRGDIDLVIERGGVCAPVEVKSFRAWNRDAERCQKALLQVEVAKEHLGAEQGFVWLPDARAGWWRRWFGRREKGQIRVVFGSARALARIAGRRLQ